MYDVVVKKVHVCYLISWRVSCYGTQNIGLHHQHLEVTDLGGS